MRVRIYSEKRVDFPHDAEKPTVKLSVEAIALEASVELEAGETLWSKRWYFTSDTT
jgi:hypothetical protein